MPYEVRWTNLSLGQLEKLDKSLSARIVEKVSSVSGDPFPFVKRLTGSKLFSLRVGDYRVILSIENKIMLIFVLEIGHRSKIYRKY
jgi:mRNA interferase RelE/StbE